MGSRAKIDQVTANIKEYEVKRVFVAQFLDPLSGGSDK